MATLAQAQAEFRDNAISFGLAKLVESEKQLKATNFMKGDDWPADVVLHPTEAVALLQMIKSLANANDIMKPLEV